MCRVHTYALRYLDTGDEARHFVCERCWYELEEHEAMAAESTRDPAQTPGPW